MAYVVHVLKGYIYKEGHAGHFMSRRHYSTRWNEENVALPMQGVIHLEEENNTNLHFFLNDKYKCDKATELLVKSRRVVNLVFLICKKNDFTKVY